MTRARWIGASLCIALALFALACGAADEGTSAAAASGDATGEAASAPSDSAIEVERVTQAALRATLQATGTIEARRLTEVSAEVGGRIEAVYVEVGDEVEAGAKLFRIAPGPYQMLVDESRAALELARAESKNAETEAARLERLVEQAVASQQRFDQLQTLAEVARARVAAAEARLARASRDLAHTEVRAPYAASIVARHAHEGALAASDPILLIQERDAFEAILDVPEASPLPIRVGDPLRLFAEGVATPIETTVERVSQRVDERTRTYAVHAALPNADHSLKAGSYVRAELEPQRETPQPVVHRSSVLNRGGRSYLLRVVAGRVVHTPVRVGILLPERAEILSGVQPGEWVVRGEAVARLAPGTPLRIRGSGERSFATIVARAAEPGT